MIRCLGRATVAAVSTALALAACGGGPWNSPSPQVALDNQVRIPASSCATTSCMYVTDRNSNAVTVYAPDATGNVAPIRTISGSKTGLTYSTQVALDASRFIYVTNRDASSVTVYAPSANGNVAPVRTVSGSKTLLNAPAGISLR
jgi:hypothetical protein